MTNVHVIGDEVWLDHQLVALLTEDIRESARDVLCERLEDGSPRVFDIKDRIRERARGGLVRLNDVFEILEEGDMTC